MNMHTATISGFFIITHTDEIAVDAYLPRIGPRFSITMEDDCCEEHARNAARAMVGSTIKWHNEVAIDKDAYEWSVAYDETSFT